MQRHRGVIISGLTAFVLAGLFALGLVNSSQASAALVTPTRVAKPTPRPTIVATATPVSESGMSVQLPYKDSFAKPRDWAQGTYPGPGIHFHPGRVRDLDSQG